MLQTAIQHHQAGRLAQAEALYREILARDPGCVDALHLLGVIAHQVGRHDAAVELIGHAIALAPHNAVFHANLGEAYRHLGRFADATESLMRAIALQPDFPSAMNNLGNALMASGRFDEAATAFQGAIKLCPELANAHYNLGILMKGRGRLAEAAACFRQSIALEPAFAEAHNNLGSLYMDQNRTADAVACFQQAIKANPDRAEFQNNLGNALRAQGRIDAALVHLRRSLATKPDCAETHNNIANAFREAGEPEQAQAHYEKALALKPDYAVALNNLAALWRDVGQLDRAYESVQRALVHDPNLCSAHNNLGLLLRDQGRYDDAMACFQRALSLRPGFGEAFNNLGIAYKDQGQLDRALDCFRRALELEPDRADIHSNVILTLQYHSGDKADVIAAEAARWQERHARTPSASTACHANDRSPSRRLRIGYVSPDLRWHPVGWFMRALLAAHDRQTVEIVVYSNARCDDRFTDQLRSQVGVWRKITGQTDQQVAERIKADQIDVLVDLALHSAGNRLPVFALKPAPVQVTYLGYPGSSGLDAIDYRLTDRFLEPSTGFTPAGPERPIRLPDTYWCYRPVIEPDLEVTDLPARRTGKITFGCLNNLCKVTPVALAAWARLLNLMPSARLILSAPDGTARKSLLASFASHQVSPNQVCFVGRTSLEDYFRSYQRIDIGLDPFPFAGGTTTCDALWMGVPLVSLGGTTPVTRGGVSILSNVGLSEFVAHSVDDYIERAAALARDLPRLAALRAGLRDRMRRSPLMDGPRFARAIEAAYRTMWRQWCAQSDRPTIPPAPAA